METRFLELNDYIRKVINNLYKLSSFLYQKVHNLKIKYLAPGTLWTVHILYLLVSP
jgi:hypothetical protein